MESTDISILITNSWRKWFSFLKGSENPVPAVNPLITLRRHQCSPLSALPSSKNIPNNRAIAFVVLFVRELSAAGYGIPSQHFSLLCCSKVYSLYLLLHQLLFQSHSRRGGGEKRSVLFLPTNSRTSDLHRIIKKQDRRRSSCIDLLPLYVCPLLYVPIPSSATPLNI